MEAISLWCVLEKSFAISASICASIRTRWMVTLETSQSHKWTNMVTEKSFVINQARDWIHVFNRLELRWKLCVWTTTVKK
jgi:hypothetical protein